MPVAHNKQDELPDVALNLPTAHDVHILCPARLLNSPVAQSVHACAFEVDEYLPTGQLLHTVAPAAANVSGEQDSGAADGDADTVGAVQVVLPVVDAAAH